MKEKLWLNDFMKRIKEKERKQRKKVECEVKSKNK